MRTTIFSYRYAQEILQHPNNAAAWNEIETILEAAPLFSYPNKSKSNKSLHVVQQLMNTYFDRRFAIDHGWQYHPLATDIAGSKLAADFRKQFAKVTIQTEIQFGNMARWYSDIFKLQAGYSQGLIHCGLCVVPMYSLAIKIDSNIVNFERVIRELPAATLSITLPILVIGLEPDENTPLVDVSKCHFESVKAIVGKGMLENQWRIVNGYIDGAAMGEIGPQSPTGRTLGDELSDDEAP
jgi:hypothetical protein